MQTNIFLPSKIKVGFNLREDTYTGKLGYIIYFDGKVWRKEGSWENWRQKVGQKISVRADGSWTQRELTVEDGVEPLEFDNTPIEGFVLNKKAGGNRYSWNPRQTYCRVYDPRGFEFEITIPNLLYILENTNSIKGKGLEGKFIYGWQGKDLILIPESSPEYQDMFEFTRLKQLKPLVKKEMVIGNIYKTNINEKHLYMGLHEVNEPKYSADYLKEVDNYFNVKKLHVFYNYKTDKIVLNPNTKHCVEFLETETNYFDYLDRFQKSFFCSKFIDSTIEYFDFKVEEKELSRHYNLKDTYIQNILTIIIPEEKKESFNNNNLYLKLYIEYNNSYYNLNMYNNEFNLLDKKFIEIARYNDEYELINGNLQTVSYNNKNRFMKFSIANIKICRITNNYTNNFTTQL